MVAQDKTFTIFSTLKTGDTIGIATVINGTASSFVLSPASNRFSISKNGTITLKVPASQLTEAPYTLNFHAIDENGNQNNTGTITVNVK